MPNAIQQTITQPIKVHSRTTGGWLEATGLSRFANDAGYVLARYGHRFLSRKFRAKDLGSSMKDCFQFSSEAYSGVGSGEELLERKADELDQSPVVKVSISSLVRSDSPRLSGENMEHARALAESDALLPPIVVHRPTMRVIDGMHRLHAAVIRGQTHLDVRFFEGTEEDAFVLAVQANILHGLPLSTADRTAAAAKIVSSHPQWSDRVIALATGLSAKTVGAIRRRSTVESPQSNTRVGRDGRARPLNSAAGRELASELLQENPNASVREIASEAGVAPSTVQDVRRRLHSGEDPVPQKQRGVEKPKEAARPDTLRIRQETRSVPSIGRIDYAEALRTLKKDPSLRFNDVGRAVLRGLEFSRIGQDAPSVAGNIPPHCAEIIIELARDNAHMWNEFAERLEVCVVDGVAGHAKRSGDVNAG